MGSVSNQHCFTEKVEIHYYKPLIDNRVSVCELLDTSRSANEAWVSRQALQDVYQKLLVMDLEFALDKKVEQELYVPSMLTHFVIIVVVP